MTQNMTKWSDTLKCKWKSWTVVAPSTLLLTMPEGHCCDMKGAIRLGMALLPEVDTIHTQAGEDKDTTYMKGADGKWQSVGRPVPVASQDV